MSCGKDSSILEETQALVSIIDDLLSISHSQKTVCQILINTYKTLTGPLMSEQETLWEKIRMYFWISKLMFESNLTTSQATTKVEDNKTVEMLAKLRGWDEAIEIVRMKMLEYTRKNNEFKKPVKEGMANGGEEVLSDIVEMEKMTEKERKQMVKSWKDRETIALQQQRALEDLMAEWDSEKVELDTEMMVCLRGIVNLKETP